MSKSKKIAFVNCFKIWGGGEKWHFEMSNYVQKKGHEVVVFTPKDGELHKRIKKENENIVLEDVKVTKHSYWNPFFQRDLYKRLKGHNINVIIFNAIDDVRYGAPASKKAGISKIIYRAGMPAAPKEKKSYLKAFSCLDEVVGISNENVDIFKRESPNLLKGVATSVITNGIDIDKFKKKSIDKDKVVFGNCVRLSDQKGLDYMLEVVKSVHSEYKEVFGVEIADKDELKDELVSMRDKFGLKDIVNFKGHVEETEEFYPELDFLLFTSKFEGSARTIIEAMACGVPVIAFDTSSMSEMIEHEKNGFLIKAFDLDQMAESCLKLMRSKDLRAELGNNARKFVEERFDQKKIYNQWYEHITK